MQKTISIACGFWAGLALASVVLGSTGTAKQAEPAQIISVEPDRAVTTPGTPITVLGERFSPDSTLYLDGIQARDTTFVDSSTIKAVTSYMQPGTYKLDLKTGGVVVRSDVTFTALP